MAATVVLGKVDRGDGQVEVTLSKDGDRFTVVVPLWVTALPEAVSLYEVMGCRIRDRQDRVRDIVERNRRV